MRYHTYMRKPHHLYYDAAGWTGAVLLIGAYTLYSLGSIPAVSFQFLAMNTIGAIGVGVYGLHKKALPVFLVMAAWAALSAYGLYVYFA